MVDVMCMGVLVVTLCFSMYRPGVLDESDVTTVLTVEKCWKHQLVAQKIGPTRDPWFTGLSSEQLVKLIYQWPFQDPRLEVPTIYKAYVREYPQKIWPYMVQYLHFRILKFPLNICLSHHLGNHPMIRFSDQLAMAPVNNGWWSIVSQPDFGCKWASSVDRKYTLELGLKMCTSRHSSKFSLELVVNF